MGNGYRVQSGKLAKRLESGDGDGLHWSHDGRGGEK